MSFNDKRSEAIDGIVGEEGHGPLPVTSREYALSPRQRVVIAAHYLEPYPRVRRRTLARADILPRNAEFDRPAVGSPLHRRRPLAVPREVVFLLRRVEHVVLRACYGRDALDEILVVLIVVDVYLHSIVVPAVAGVVTFRRKSFDAVGVVLRAGDGDVNRVGSQDNPPRRFVLKRSGAVARPNL